MKNRIIAFISFMVTSYLVVSFVRWDFDVSTMTVFDRGFYAFIAMIISGFAACFPILED